jgi:hypothetical protein
MSMLCKNCVTKGQNSKGSTLSKDRLVYVKYVDHVLFKDIDPKTIEPQVRETVGWLTEQNEDFIRIEWERFIDEFSSPAISAHRTSENMKQRATGLAILRSCILELEEMK